MNVLYHGTSKHNAAQIEKHGFKGITFLTADINIAQGYGSVVFKVTLEDKPRNLAIRTIDKGMGIENDLASGIEWVAPGDDVERVLWDIERIIH